LSGVAEYGRQVVLCRGCAAVFDGCATGLFIDVGTNYSVLDHTNLSFIYEDVLSPGPNSDGEFVRIPVFSLLGVHGNTRVCLSVSVSVKVQLMVVLKGLTDYNYLDCILTQTDRRRLEAFEMWIWRRMEKDQLA